MELARAARKILWRYFKVALLAALLGFVVRSFIVEAYRVTATTMSPTLQPGDSFLILKPEFGLTIPLLDYKIGKPRIPHRGEVIVYQVSFPPNFDVAQRVVALPGEKVAVRNGILFVNGRPLGFDPDYSPSDLRCRQEGAVYSLHHLVCRDTPLIEDHPEVVLKPDQVFVMGDRRIIGPNDGKKFRTWGIVPITSIRGTAWRIWISVNLDKAAERLRWDRILKPVSKQTQNSKGSP